MNEMNYIKATLSAFGPDEGVTFTQDTWAQLHKAMNGLVSQPAPVPLTDEQKVLRSLLGAALGALRYHTEQTRPIQRTNETITAIEHELAAHGITKGQPC